MKSTCTACKKIFSSDRAFDKHRVGPIVQGLPPGQGARERRCLNEREMLERGMVQGRAGLWGREAMNRDFSEAAAD